MLQDGFCFGFVEFEVETAAQRAIEVCLMKRSVSHLYACIVRMRRLIARYYLIVIS